MAPFFGSFLSSIDPLGLLVLVGAAAPCLWLTYWAYYIISWYRNICLIGREVNKLPGERPELLFGNLRQHPGGCEAMFQWFIDSCERHGGYVFRLWLGPFRPGVHFCHPDTVRLILRTADPKAVRGNGGYGRLRPWLGDGLLISSGAKWFRTRKLLTPAFHFDILKSYIQVYNDAANCLLDKWNEELTANGPGKSVEICSLVSRCSLNIILRCAFSYNSDWEETSTSDTYVKYVMSLAQMLTQRTFKVHWHIDWIYYRTSHGKSFVEKCDYVHKVADKLIQQRKRTLAEDQNILQRKHKDFLDILILARDDDGNGLTDLEIRNEVDTFLFEGHDTTASAISWCLYNLASHADVQEKAWREVDSLVRGLETPSITWDDLSQLPYLSLCIKESLRLHPPVPFIARDLESPLTVNGVMLLPGTVVAVSIWNVHHNVLVWGKDHMEYKPERFNPDKVRDMDSHAFIPFAAGPRNCIGQQFAQNEIKVVIARILLKYKFEVDLSHPVEMMPELTLRAKYGIKLHLTPRTV